MENEKFTAIYIDSWMSGSNSCSLTKMKRFELRENETINTALKRLNISKSIVYLFGGWPLLQGETEKEMLESVSL